MKCLQVKHNNTMIKLVVKHNNAMIKLRSSTQISSVHYRQFRPPGLNTCINLVNRKEPLIWMNSGMNLGGRIASPQGTHSFLVVSESPWCAQNKISPLQCPPLPAELLTVLGLQWCEAGCADGVGWGLLLLHFCFQKLVSSPSCMPWALYAMAHCPRPFNCTG